MVVSNPAFVYYEVDWTPDGRLIYGRSSSSSSGSVDSMRIFVSDGGVERQLVPDVPSPARANYGDSWVSWSR